MRRLIQIVTDVFFTALMLLLVGGALAYFAFGYRPYVVMSGSMEPTIHTGSLAIVDTQAEFHEADVDDVIAFDVQGTRVTHRVVNKDTDGKLTTKGDANKVVDAGFVTKSNFVGKTIFAIPNVGYFLSWVKTTQGMIVIGTLFAAIILIDVLLRLQR